MTDSEKMAHAIVAGEKNRLRSKMICSFRGIPITEEHFTFDELVTMLTMENEKFINQLEGLRYLAEVKRGRL